MPDMTPTYPENIRLLGPTSWEEIESQHTTDRQTDRQTDRPQKFHPPPQTHNACGKLLIFYTQVSLALLPWLG